MKLFELFPVLLVVSCRIFVAATLYETIAIPQYEDPASYIGETLKPFNLPFVLTDVPTMLKLKKKDLRLAEMKKEPAGRVEISIMDSITRMIPVLVEMLDKSTEYYPKKDKKILLEFNESNQRLYVTLLTKDLHRLTEPFLVTETDSFPLSLARGQIVRVAAWGEPGSDVSLFSAIESMRTHDSVSLSIDEFEKVTKGMKSSELISFGKSKSYLDPMLNTLEIARGKISEVENRARYPVTLYGDMVQMVNKYIKDTKHLANVIISKKLDVIMAIGRDTLLVSLGIHDYYGPMIMDKVDHFILSGKSRQMTHVISSFSRPMGRGRVWDSEVQAMLSSPDMNEPMYITFSTLKRLILLGENFKRRIVAFRPAVKDIEGSMDVRSYALIGAESEKKKTGLRELIKGNYIVLTQETVNEMFSKLSGEKNKKGEFLTYKDYSPNHQIRLSLLGTFGRPNSISEIRGFKLTNLNLKRSVEIDYEFMAAEQEKDKKKELGKGTPSTPS